MTPARNGRDGRGAFPRLRPDPGATRFLMRGQATASSPAVSAETLSPQPSPVIRRVGGPQGPHAEVPTSIAQRARMWLSQRDRKSVV